MTNRELEVFGELVQIKNRLENLMEALVAGSPLSPPSPDPRGPSTATGEAETGTQEDQP